MNGEQISYGYINLYHENLKNEMLNLIKGFWLAHSNYNQSDEEALHDLLN